jgi:hypothetical protein
MRLTADNPCFGMSYHSYQAPQNLVVSTVQGFCSLSIQVTTFDGKFDPNLGFCSFRFRVCDLADEGGPITPVPPGLG